MTGKIIKGIAGFYYVHDGKDRVYECKAKGIFRNKKIKPLVGDNVEFSVLDEAGGEGNIDAILPRSNALVRPAVANIDQALVVFALTHPSPNLNLLDRFLVMMEIQQVPVIICFNKMDLGDDGLMETYRSIYEAAGYEVKFISAIDETGVEEVRKILGPGRPVGSGKILTDQLYPAPGSHGDRGYQPKNRAGKAYHPPFPAVLRGGKHVHDGHAGIQFHVHTGFGGRGPEGLLS